ncbi:transcriptional regulator [Sediminicola luteus]|uniref:Transcriptional regulator n=1 Tax=Sediminicola luteus TaxID=319238 RepID=A0A2A4G9P0_9FLAO|nr:transcriptional regulator [Sediminicola luteus]PCE64696.1 transcriptional regulator [Sediminicola luteus]
MKSIAVITGDVIKSRDGEPKEWLNILKDTLQQYGSSPKDWDVYRGDSFQLAIAPQKALTAALHIKASIKQNKLHDARMGIGIGTFQFEAQKITESNGQAFVNSGACFESLKTQTLAIKTDQPQLNDSLNTMFGLALLTIDHWSSPVSKTIKVALENPDKNQSQLAQLLNHTQSNTSKALKRGGFDEIMAMNAYYVKNISKL